MCDVVDVFDVYSLIQRTFVVSFQFWNRDKKKCDYCVDDDDHDCVLNFVSNYFRNVVRTTTNRFATHSNLRTHVLILRVVFFQKKKNNRNDWRVFFIENTIDNSTNNVDHHNNRFRNRRNRCNIFVVFCFCCFFFCVSSFFFFF